MSPLRKFATRAQLAALRWLRDKHQPMDDLVTGELFCVECLTAWPCVELQNLSDRIAALKEADTWKA